MFETNCILSKIYTFLGLEGCLYLDKKVMKLNYYCLCILLPFTLRKSSVIGSISYIRRPFPQATNLLASLQDHKTPGPNRFDALGSSF